MDRGGRDNIPYQELAQCDCSEKQIVEDTETNNYCDKKCCGEKSDEEECSANREQDEEGKDACGKTCCGETSSGERSSSNASGNERESQACEKSCCCERHPEEECCGQNKGDTKSSGTKCCEGVSCSKSGNGKEDSSKNCCEEVSCSKSGNNHGATDEKCCDNKCCDAKKEEEAQKNSSEEELKPTVKRTFQLCTTNESEELESCCYVALEEKGEVPTWNTDEKNDGNFMTTSIITTKLRVQNVCCGKEGDLIKSTLAPIDGVKAVTVNTVARTAMVRHSPITLPRSALIRKLNELHLGVSLIESGESASKESMTRDLVASLALQGAIMSLLLALYIVVIVGSLENLIWHKYVAITLICIALLPITRKTFNNWRRKVFVDMNLLVLITSIGIMYLGEWFETCTILIIFLGAEILQELCFYKVRKTIAGMFCHLSFLILSMCDQI